MTRWDIEQPQTLELGDVRTLRLRVVAGDVNVTAGNGPARLEVSSISGDPLRVSLDDGVLTVTYDDVSWGGILDWLSHGRQRREVSLALVIPAGCEVELGTVSAEAVVSGTTAPVRVRSVSGEVTLDGLAGPVSARTVSGDVEALAIDGELSFQTVSGDLTVASGSATGVSATTVSGDVALSVQLAAKGSLDVTTVSGDVVLRVPDLAAAVVVDSVSGELTSPYDGIAASRKPGRKHWEGTIGDGGGSLRVKTVSGDVDLLVGSPG